MAVQEFKLVNLPLVNGGMLAAAFDQLIERCAQDCEDRPAHDKAREVILTVKFQPTPTGKDLDTVSGEVSLSAKLPKIELPSISFGFRKKRGANGKQSGMLVFNDMSEDDIHQRTIDELE